MSSSFAGSLAAPVSILACGPAASLCLPYQLTTRRIDHALGSLPDRPRMFVDSIGTQGGAVVGATRNAARATGADFQYLLATARVESGLDPRAALSSSSAKGRFQFIARPASTC